MNEGPDLTGELSSYITGAEPDQAPRAVIDRAQSALEQIRALERMPDTAALLESLRL